MFVPFQTKRQHEIHHEAGQPQSASCCYASSQCKSKDYRLAVKPEREILSPMTEFFCHLYCLRKKKERVWKGLLWVSFCANHPALRLLPSESSKQITVTWWALYLDQCLTHSSLPSSASSTTPRAAFPQIIYCLHLLDRFSGKTGTIAAKCILAEQGVALYKLILSPHSCWVHVCQTVEKYSTWKSVRGTLPLKHGACWAGFVIFFFLCLHFAFASTNMSSICRLSTSLVITHLLWVNYCTDLLTQI